MMFPTRHLEFSTFVPCLILGVGIVASGCNGAGEGQNSQSETALGLAPAAPTSSSSSAISTSSPASGGSGRVVDWSHTVCDPLQPGSSWSGSPDLGLIAQLSYLPNGHVGEYHGVDNLIHLSTPVNADIYFTDLNIPTRLFTEGFNAGDGTLLTDLKGDPLLEFFALQFESVIELSADDSPGLYQFALLSDDGSLMSISSDSVGDPVGDPAGADSQLNFVPFINNDGDHPATLGCALEAIPFDATTQLPMQLAYYQGPRYEIALMLLWRKVSDHSAASLSDPACGRAGNTEFFNPYTIPSSPSEIYEGMIARGWKPLIPANFHIPEGELSNPCGSQPTVSCKGLFCSSGASS